MEARRCESCGKRLPKGLRVDARFCPGVRCRVAACRKRRRNRVATLLGPTRQDSGAVLATIQQKRKQIGWPAFSHDRWCQLQAEILACDILRDYYYDKKWKLKDEQWKVARPWSAKESELSRGQAVLVLKEIRRVGLAVLPADCKVRAVLVTSKD